MDARRTEAFEPSRYPVFERQRRAESERRIARLPRVRSAAELAECTCPDGDCLVDHGN